MTTVNKHKILKNLPIFLSAGLILAAGFVFVHFSAKNKNPGQGEVLGQNLLTQTTAQTSLSENPAYGEKSAALQPTPAPESAADRQANKPNAALPNSEKKPDVEHELIPGDPLIRGGGGTGSTNFRGGSGGGGGTVSYVSDTDQTPATGSTITYNSFAVSGTNPVIVLLIAIDSRTESVSSVNLSGGLSGGTPVEVKTARDTGPALTTYVSVWCIPAPSGTGTITANLSGSVPYQSNAILMSGADQTTPCPTGDAVSANSVTNPLSVTPTNLTANDAAVGMGANAEQGDAPTFQQTETFNNNTTFVNAAGGYHLGTGAISVSWGTPTNDDILVGLRVKAASGGGTIGSVKFR